MKISSPNSSGENSRNSFLFPDERRIIGLRKESSLTTKGEITMSNMNLNELGTFEITSGQVVITDPCYTDVAEKMVPALNGTWKAAAYVDENRVTTSLIVAHEKYFSRYPGYCGELDFSCPVDSGQAGVFDAELYNRHKGGEYSDLNTFYGRVCAATRYVGGTVEMKGVTFGVATNSGFGDGSYPIYGQFVDGKLVSAYIEYVSDEYYEDEEDNW